MEIICNLCEHEKVCKHKENVELLTKSLDEDMNTISEFHELIGMISLDLFCSNYIKKSTYQTRQNNTASKDSVFIDKIRRGENTSVSDIKK